MKTFPTTFFSILFTLMCFCASASADTLIAGFESGLDGFAGDTGTVSTGSTGATEGTSALQFTTAAEFDFATSFEFFGPLTDVTNDTIKFDASFTPDDPAMTTFAQVSFGINSNGNNIAGNNFQFAPLVGIAIDGTTTAFELNFADLPEFPLTNPDLNFAGLLLITNTNGSGVFTFDNIRLHTVAAVPEPSSLACLGVLGFLGLVQRRRR